MTYRAPVSDIAVALKHTSGLKEALAEGRYGEMDEDTIDAVLEEAGKFASDVIAPLNRVGDKFGTPFKDGNVTTPPGWKDAYPSWAAAGWTGLAAPSDFGGQDLPQADHAACIEMWTAASRAADGTYRLTGAKIFITYGEHDLTDNIIHFVLARRPDAPEGTKGISFFLVPL